MVLLETFALAELSFVPNIQITSLIASFLKYVCDIWFFFVVCVLFVKQFASDRWTEVCVFDGRVCCRTIWESTPHVYRTINEQNIWHYFCVNVVYIFLSLDVPKLSKIIWIPISSESSLWITILRSHKNSSLKCTCWFHFINIVFLFLSDSFILS